MPSDPTAETESESEEQRKQFVTESAARSAVLGRLVDGPTGPAGIARRKPAGIASVASAASSLSTADAKAAAEELREHELVELFTSDDVHAYGLTATGESVLFSIKQDE